MQSGYGGVSEMQPFMEDSSSQNPFSISSTQSPSAAASPSVTGDGHELHGLAGAAPFHQLIIHPFHPHQHAHYNPPSPPAIMQFPHYHSIPITQQLFTRLPHPQHHPHRFRLFQPTPPLLEHEAEDNSRGGIMHPFLAAADDSSGSSVFQDDDASESRFRPWHRQEDCHIKDPFWRRPLDMYCINLNNKRHKNKELGEAALHLCSDEDKRSHELAAGLENSQPQPTQLFNELEAIYRPGGSAFITSNANATNQTTASGSALTGDDRSVIPSGGEGHPELKRSARKKSLGLMKKVQMESISEYFSGMVKKLMDHQESLHQRFVIAMERRDRERARREEAWRVDEVARARREAVARANEQALTVAREATIISFVEKITAKTLHLPSSNNCSHLTTGDDEKQDINAQGSNTATTIMMTNRRWPRPEVEALIRARSGLEWRSQEPGLKGPLWEDVSASLAAQGYQRSAKRCKEKWENINKYFRKAKNSGRKRSQNSKTCPYFRQLDQLYSVTSDPPPGSVRKKKSDLFDDDDVLAGDHDQGAAEKERTNQVGSFDYERL